MYKSLKNSVKYFVVFFFVGIVLWACRKDSLEQRLINPIENATWLGTIEYPDDNLPNKARFDLGKKLFYDSRLSMDGTISCASCHQPHLAFADNEPISPGVEGRLGFRNAPTLVNVAFQEDLFTDGGVPNLELQVLAPLEDHNEMGINILQAVEIIKNDPEYIDLCKKAYDRSPDPYSIVRGIAAFERQIISSQTDWEQEVYNGQSTMSETAQKGWKVFQMSGCTSCHNGPNLTDMKYHNIGLYSVYEDVGRYRITLDSSDIGRFKTPTLRNVMLTAPYMHNGSLSTIDDVLNHFQSGGVFHINKDSRIQPQNWTEDDKTYLKAFFHSLTDISFIEQYDLN